jgi:FkbM family methyltransferase
MADFYIRHLNGERTSNRDYEYDEQKMLGAVLRPGDRTLQLGGNVGTSCIYASALHPDLGYNICVEPSDEVLPLLRRNIEENGMSGKVEVIHGAVLPECREGQRLYLSTEADDVSNNNWSAFLVHGGYAEERRGRPVRCVTVEEALRGRPPPDVIFADCEGCFPAIMDGSPELLEAARAVILEVDGGDLGDRETVDALEAYGFACSRVLSDLHPTIPYLLCAKTVEATH